MISKDTLPGTEVVVDGYAAIVVDVCGAWVLCALVGQDGGVDSGFCYALPSFADACKKLGLDPEARYYYYYCPYLNSDRIRLAKEETMKSADIKVEVGQIWNCNSVGRYEITSIQGTLAYAKNHRNPDSKEVVFGGLTSDGKPLYWAGNWKLEEPTKPIEVSKPVIVKVGQVWSSSYASYQITKIDGKTVFGKDLDASSLETEVMFGYLTSDGKPEWNTDAWKLKEETMTSNATEDKPIDQVQASQAPKLRALTKDDKPGTKIMVDGNIATIICRDPDSAPYIYYRYDEPNVGSSILTHDAKSTYALAATALGFDHKEKRYSGRDESNVSVIEEQPKPKRYMDKDTKPGTKVLFNGKVMTYVSAQQTMYAAALLHCDAGGSVITTEWAVKAAEALGFNSDMPKYHAASYHQCEIIEGAEPVKLVAKEPAKKYAAPDTKPGARVRIYGREGVLVCNHKHSPGNALVYMDNGNGSTPYQYTIRSAWAHNAAKALKLKPYARRYDDYPYEMIEIIEEAKEEVKPKEEPAAPLKEEPVVAVKKFATKDTKPGTKVMFQGEEMIFVCNHQESGGAECALLYGTHHNGGYANHFSWAEEPAKALGLDRNDYHWRGAFLDDVEIIEEPIVKKRFATKDTKSGTKVRINGTEGILVCNNQTFNHEGLVFHHGQNYGSIQGEDWAVSVARALNLPTDVGYSSYMYEQIEIVEEPTETTQEQPQKQEEPMATQEKAKQYATADTKPGTKVLYNGRKATFVCNHASPGCMLLHYDDGQSAPGGNIGNVSWAQKPAKDLGLDTEDMRWTAVDYCSKIEIIEETKPKSSLGLLIAGVLFGGVLAGMKKNEVSARISSIEEEDASELTEASSVPEEQTHANA